MPDPFFTPFVKKKWEELFPHKPIEYFFLSDYINKKFHSQAQFGKITGIFAGVGVFIACLGLFGLADFRMTQRTKEIGIRKVHGASISNISALLTKEFINWIFFANAFAWPIAYFAIDMWLQNFPYRIMINPTIFIITAISTFLIALLTVAYQVIKASLTNPVDSLRYE